MSYRRILKGLNRRKLTIGMFTGKASDFTIKGCLTPCKYEVRCGHGFGDFSKIVVTSIRNREDVIKELILHVQGRQLGKKMGVLYKRPYQIWVTEKGGEKELLLDSRYHVDFIMFLTDKIPNTYA